MAYLAATQALVVEIEEDMIIVGKWKREVQIPNSQASTSGSTNPIVQRLVNDMIQMKRQLPKPATPYQDIPRRNPNQGEGTFGKQSNILLGKQKLLIEGPSANIGNMYIFHLTDDHDGSSCPEMVRYHQMETNKENIVEMPNDEGTLGGPGDFMSYYLEYQLDYDRGHSVLLTLGDPSCSKLTKNQHVLITGKINMLSKLPLNLPLWLLTENKRN